MVVVADCCIPLPVFVHFPTLQVESHLSHCCSLIISSNNDHSCLSIHPEYPGEPLEKDTADPHGHHVGLCRPVVVVEHHHRQHHAARHHHHDAVEVGAWTEIFCNPEPERKLNSR